MTAARLFGAAAAAALCLLSVRAEAYSLADYDWCFNNMPGFYDRQFEACVDAKCTRIGNKNPSAKRSCYRTCKGETVEACAAHRAQGQPSPAQAAMPAGSRDGNAAAASREPSPDAASPAAEGARQGFFTRLMDGVGRGVTEGFDADYNWCRDNSGGAFQDALQACTRGCLAGPSSATSKRQGCIQSCRVTSVRDCIARRDDK